MVQVTPFVGVWIETKTAFRNHPEKAVTPFVGVWIETVMVITNLVISQRHTLRGCVD